MQHASFFKLNNEQMEVMDKCIVDCNIYTYLYSNLGDVGVCLGINLICPGNTKVKHFQAFPKV